MAKIILFASVLVIGVLLMQFRVGCIVAAMDDTVDTEGTRIMYDQRQSGKYNIHVVIKDVAIVEMAQNAFQDVDYSSDDYYYDENDLTVKPMTLSPTIPTTKLQTYNIDLKSKDSEPYLITTLTNQVPGRTPLMLPTQKKKNKGTTTRYSTQPANAYGHASNNTITNVISNPTKSSVHEELTLQPQFREASIAFENSSKTPTKSKIYNVKVHRSHQTHNYNLTKLHSRRCRSNQYKDISGNCRIRRSRSGSLLQRLFSMLDALSFNAEKVDDNL